jgi:hypothetical protein
LNFLRFVFPLQVFATLAMFGVIWFVQIVHYPLFLSVGPDQFPAYETAHANRTTYIVAPLMLIELVTAGLMLFPPLRPLSVTMLTAWFGAVLVVVIWVSTAFLQVPLHDQLHASYSAPIIRRLVATNWIRTVAWTLRACLILLWLMPPKSIVR